jgi:DNA gyrase subunit A
VPANLPSQEQLDLFADPRQGAPAPEAPLPEAPDAEPPPETRIMARSPGSRPAKKSTVAPRESRTSARGGGGGRPPDDTVSGGGGGGGEQDTSLQAEARRRYLNYALSVITSRALPDVRDGLKPVQRRILYAMLNDEHLRPDAKYRKSAKVVGTVIGRYHPHGDTAVYDTMVRMAQDFTLRVPLVDGSGNFGSLDGDAPAAYRYTECRLAPPAMELLRELDQATVDMRANYDGTTEEPVVLPARFPNLLVNGSTGIAVGMATNIPPHNLREVVNALIALADKPDINTTGLMTHIKGPDFPTGGQVLNSKPELRTIYEAGQGSIRVRGEYRLEDKKRGGQDLVITSIPYGPNKASLVERIAEVIISRKLPHLVDVRDESTTDVRIVLELKRDADPALVMAYLYKNTPLQQNFNLNLTCLVPADVTAGPSAPPQPKPQMPLKEVLQHFLTFRLDITRKRFQYQLRRLEERIHILEAFVTIFDALDEVIKIIRKSDGKADASAKLMKRWGLDEVQVDAILELKLYKLARLEILVIREELSAKEKEATRIRAILKSEDSLNQEVLGDLRAVAAELGTPRKTKIGGAGEELEFDADAFIVEEDANVVVTRDGWIKRVRELKDPTSTRTREGDEVMAVLPGSTREKVAFFTNRGSAYVLKINDVTATTGYGDPAQKYFKFDDGERIVCAMALDPRANLPETLLAVTGRGYGLRFALAAHAEPTTKAGRRYARPPAGDEVIGVEPCGDGDAVVVATRDAHVLVCKAEDIARLEGPGRGVTVIKTDDDDAVIGFACGDKHTKLVVEKGGKREELAADPRHAVSRGGRGHQLSRRAKLTLVTPPVQIVTLAAPTEGGN